MENKLHTKKHILLCNNDGETSDELKYIKKHFCGLVVDDFMKVNQVTEFGTIVYVYGNIQNVLNGINTNGKIINVIKEISSDYENICGINLVTFGEVPINIHNVGVFFRQLFDPNKKYFELLNERHKFQSLTESNKSGTSYRNGIYLTRVEEIEGITHFNLLRCSTNLSGPTDNFSEVDNEIVGKVNDIAADFFEQKTDLNHVLAQVYNNVKVNGKDRKAKIANHSDKTKDMPINGLMAFTTFYRWNDKLQGIKKSATDPYDYHYKDASALTKLSFRLKKCVNDPRYVDKFDIILYPNSVFLMSLHTNRLYTHEIIPAHLPIEKLPVRMGYVIRCSKTKAVFKDNQTYIQNGNELIKLENPTSSAVKELKDLYFNENTTDQLINYGTINFSLNNGDYLKPLV